ncbi:hypothetical protein ABZ905_32075 [Streptomyces parvus]|uniref:hypothetical protein n=1 Tax=Streptomyces parvus TaxID=66428 RepID=UPI0034010873
MTKTSAPSPTRGRPSKLTLKLISSLAGAVEAGKSREKAAKSAGISPGTFARYLATGRKALEAGGGSNEFEVQCAVLRLRISEADNVARQKQLQAAPQAPADAVTARPVAAGAVTTVRVGAPTAGPAGPVISVGRPRRRSFFGRLTANVVRALVGDHH